MAGERVQVYELRKVERFLKLLLFNRKWGYFAFFMKFSFKYAPSYLISRCVYHMLIICNRNFGGLFACIRGHGREYGGAGGGVGDEMI